MVHTIKISNAEMNLINNLLNLTNDEIYQKYGYKRDETITHTAKFPNGIEANIKLVICEEETPYTEGVLFHNGFELTCTEPDCTYDGEWNFEHNGIEYIVNVETEMTKEQQEKLCAIYNASDIEALDYMYEFLKDNHNSEMLELLDRVHTLNMETTLGWGKENYTSEEAKEYFDGKWKLLNYFGIKSDLGDAYIE